MLDTNIVSDLIRNPLGKAAQRTERAGADTVCVSIIVAAELRYGAAKGKSFRIGDLVEGLLARLPVLPLDMPADADYAAIRTQLENAGTPISANDLLIAAHALALRMPLVTADSAFRRVSGLQVENWLE
ncbi:tRNA(fMet)-specific endonuclease VapC [Roseiarcus fermentans]|uniref:Ribonuclease VapC n=2 Tax=Roseiarcus fermentans TaxID=1473586 RepID=A0A366ENS5_9HYPH|nr:tRNA(fMet)-specific endonuclease VapC [Roseiarcus fermentans]